MPLAGQRTAHGIHIMSNIEPASFPMDKFPLPFDPDGGNWSDNASNPCNRVVAQGLRRFRQGKGFENVKSGYKVRRHRIPDRGAERGFTRSHFCFGVCDLFSGRRGNAVPADHGRAPA